MGSSRTGQRAGMEGAEYKRVLFQLLMYFSLQKKLVSAAAHTEVDTAPAPPQVMDAVHLSPEQVCQKLND